MDSSKILLLMLAVSPCAATWSPRRRAASVLIYPWPLRLLTVQMAAIYFMKSRNKKDELYATEEAERLTDMAAGAYPGE